MYVSCSSCNKVPHAEGLKTLYLNHCTQFWRPEARDQGAGAVGSPENLLQASLIPPAGLLEARAALQVALPGLCPQAHSVISPCVCLGFFPSRDTRPPVFRASLKLVAPRLTVIASAKTLCPRQVPLAVPWAIMSLISLGVPVRPTTVSCAFCGEQAALACCRDLCPRGHLVMQVTVCSAARCLARWSDGEGQESFSFPSSST